jgi:hypothetical protein
MKHITIAAVDTCLTLSSIPVAQAKGIITLPQCHCRLRDWTSHGREKGARRKSLPPIGATAASRQAGSARDLIAP